MSGSVLLLLYGPLEVGVLEALGREEIDVVRRCSDEVELAGAAEAGLGSVVVTETLDLNLAALFHAAGLQIVGVGLERQTGEDFLASPNAEDVVNCVRAALSQSKPAAPEPPAIRHPDVGAGTVCAVWGTDGAPGRSVLARDLANALASKLEVLLVDGDTRNPCLSQLLGVRQETSAIVALARKINTGSAGQEEIEKYLLHMPQGFHFLAGLNKGSRWRELPGPVLGQMWARLRSCAALIIADCAAGIERNEFGFDEDRDAATLSLLENADMRLLVAKATPVGLRRLIAQIELANEAGIADFHIVLTRAQEREKLAIRDILRGRGGEGVSWVRSDAGHYDAAERRGLSLLEVSPKAGAASDTRRLAARLENAVRSQLDPANRPSGRRAR